MRFVLPLLFLFYPITLTAQSLPEWYRVYSFDESTIEMNTALVTQIDKDISRLRFRWTFDNPDSLDDSKYQSQLEVMEFNCTASLYRSYHLTYFDRAGNIVRIQDSPGNWRPVTPGSMIEKLFVPGCELIKTKTRAPVQSDESVQLQKAAQYAHDFAQQLEETKDFRFVIDRFFVSDYLNSYLQDEKTNWFLNLKRDTATKISREELERFYVAMMNAGYLTSFYLISQLPAGPDSVEKSLPPDVLELLNQHRYTVQYQTRKGNYDFLAETIEDVEQLRSYIDLLERISSLMRVHVETVGAQHTGKWKAMLEHWNLYQPKPRVCVKDCLGLPKDTKIFGVDVPLFHLQIAEISGELKVVSARSRF